MTDAGAAPTPLVRVLYFAFCVLPRAKVQPRSAIYRARARRAGGARRFRGVRNSFLNCFRQTIRSPTGGSRRVLNDPADCGRGVVSTPLRPFVNAGRRTQLAPPANT